MNIEKQAGDIRRNLSEISKQLGVDYKHIETEFLLERFLARITSEKYLLDHIVFKGGFVGMKIYESKRYTSDIDATLSRTSVEKITQLVKESVEKSDDDGVWFQYESQSEIEAQGGYGGVRFSFRGGIGKQPENTIRSQSIHFDIGIGNPMTIPPNQIKIKPLLPKYEEIQWRVYPIETIIAEKLHAMVARGSFNSRSKDFYDLSIFLEKANKTLVHESIHKCFGFRKTEIPRSFSDFARSLDTEIIERGWKRALLSQKDAPSFQDTFNKLLRELSELDQKRHRSIER